MVSKTDNIHISAIIIITDAITPIIADLKNLLLPLSKYEIERKKITSDTNVFRGELFYNMVFIFCSFQP